MDLHETRRIPMWLAHPALPVAAGAALLLVLVGLELFAQPPAPTPDEPGEAIVLGPDQAAGKLRGAPEPTAGDAVASLLRDTRTRAQGGDYVGALELLATLTPEQRAGEVAKRFDIAGWEQNCVQRGFERLQLRLRKLPPEESVALLSSFLALQAVRGQPAEREAQEALRALEGSAQRDGPDADRER